MQSAENAAPQRAAPSKAEQIAWLGKLTKSNAGPAERSRVRDCLEAFDWGTVWHALKAAKKIACAGECAALIAAKIDCVQTVPSGKRSYYIKALEAAAIAAGSSMKPHMEEILQRALLPEQEPRWDDDDFDYDAYDGASNTRDCARGVLRDLRAHVTEAQAQCVIAKLEDASPGVRAAALDVATHCLPGSFVTPAVVRLILLCSRDPKVLVRDEAVSALQCCIGFEWRYSKRSVLSGLATSRADHDACKARLLELRHDEAKQVRDTVKDALEMLEYREGGGSEGGGSDSGGD